MAKVMFARLCREIRKSPRGGSYSLTGRFSQLRMPNGPVGFVCVVYWERGEETFRQSFTLRDEVGNVLDETPATDCMLTKEHQNISTALFYAMFPEPGEYSIDVYQNGACTDSIPFRVVEPFQSLKRPPAAIQPAVQP